jgi:6-methylpretetramide 4-monooxygenase
METRLIASDARSSDSYDVLVVGAGLGGLAFTLAMENSGLRIAVVDRNPSPDGQALGWGNDLQPNGIAVLDSLGVLDEAKHEGAQHYQWFAERFGGALLSRWDYSMLDHSHPYAVCIRPHLLRRIMLTRVKSYASIICGEFVNCSATQGTQRVEVRERGETRTYEAKLVVGADGPFSRVRQAAKLECTVTKYGLNWANTIIPKDEDDVPEGHVFFGRGVYLGVVPTRARELVTFHLTGRGSRDDYIREFGTIDKLRSYYVEIAPILGKCSENLQSWDQVACPPAVRIRARSWVTNGVALVGDAALNVNPVTSQGASLALESGVQLAAVAKQCFEHGDFSAGALAAYESACRPKAESIQSLGDKSLFFFSNRNRILNAMKERVLKRVESDLPMKRKLMGAFCGVTERAAKKVDWRDALAAAGLWPVNRGTEMLSTGRV